FRLQPTKRPRSHRTALQPPSRPSRLHHHLNDTSIGNSAPNWCAEGVGAMSDVPLSSHERSSTEGPETRPDSPTAETAPVTPSAAMATNLPPTEPDDADELDVDLTYLLSPPSEPSALGRLAHYEVFRLVGRGGMGRVFQAFDTALQRPVAIK